MLQLLIFIDTKKLLIDNKTCESRVFGYIFTSIYEKGGCMKVSAISNNPAEDCRPRRNLFIRFSNSFMSVPECENPIEKAAAAPVEKPAKLGIENLQEFTIFPKEVVDGRTIITA